MRKTELLIALDPGLTTGVAAYEATHEQRPSANEMPFGELVRALESWAGLYGDYDVHVVCERYNISERTTKLTRQYDALHVIGAVRSLADRRDNVTLEKLQTPFDAKEFATNARLKAAGWYRPGLGHANDALRHLMLWMVRTGRMEAPRA
jgi:hypothetical protein